MQVYQATPDIVVDSCWYPNSGSTNHLTLDESNLNLHIEYNGKQQIHMGNGTGYPIKHIGHSFIYSPSNTQQRVLHNLLHVP